MFAPAMAIKIEWTNHTWNPWWGCDKIAPECDNCYAAVFASRALHSANAGVAKKGKWAGKITHGPDSVYGQVIDSDRGPDAPPDQRYAVLGFDPDTTERYWRTRPEGDCKRRLLKAARKLPRSGPSQPDTGAITVEPRQTVIDGVHRAQRRL